MKSSSPLGVLCLFVLFSCQTPLKQKADFEIISFAGKGNSSLPVLTSDGENLLFSYVEKIDDSTAGLFYSRWESGQFDSPKQITQGKDWFVNWADYPAIVENRGNLLAHILQKSSAETFSYDVKLQALPKGKTAWETGLSLHRDSTLTEHGFVTAIAYSDSSYLVTWLDGRNTGGGHGHGGHSGAMSLRAAEVGLSGNVLWDELLDARVCDCCQTSAAMSSKGPVIVYRNRSDREIRDIAITRLVEGKWTEPRIVHPDSWEITGCPVNGPEVAALDETVLVGWFTDVHQEGQVKIAFSSDAGANFGEAQKIGTQGSIGRVDVTLLDADTGLVSWMGMENDSTFLFAQRVAKSGKVFPAHRVAAMDPTRKSGFPQMEKHQGKIYFAWTVVGEEEQSIALVSIPEEEI